MTSAVEEQLQSEVLDWFSRAARDLPWRAADCSPWGVLVSEIMLQQTPVVRVLPVWHEWLARWPTPGDLAAESSGEAVRAWGRLGYPRRALRLHAAATVIAQDHDGRVPRDPVELRALPGIGEYTAAAVSAFAFGDPATVVDTNVRRVLARARSGEALPAMSLNRAEMRLAHENVPADRERAAAWNAGVMELGALVCKARSPECDVCPIRSHCAWRAAGYPPYAGPPRKGQAWDGTDRQCRGALLQVLRSRDEPIPAEQLSLAWADAEQRERCVASLLADQLLEKAPAGHYRLPG